jgi:hypothetical protein
MTARTELAGFSRVSAQSNPRGLSMFTNTSYGRYALAVCAIYVLFPTVTTAAGESKLDTIGPWKIEAVFKGDSWDGCSINRTLQDDIVATFARTGQTLRLELQSPNWKLEDGKHYPVTMNIGSLSINTEVAAAPNSVSTEIKDEKFAAMLRLANTLNVVGTGATIRVPLDKSKVAFNRLEECIEKNNSAIQATSFGTGTGVSEGKPCNGNTAETQGVHAITPEETKTLRATGAAKQGKVSPRGKFRTARSRPLPYFLRRVDLLPSGRR